MVDAKDKNAERFRKMLADAFKLFTYKASPATINRLADLLADESEVLFHYETAVNALVIGYLAGRKVR